jgi:tetratricopeptide (TPR) repeat protein
LLAGICIQKSQPDSAVPILEKEIAHGRMLGKSQSGALIMPLMLRAEVYKQKKDYNSALQDAEESVKYAEQDNSRQRMVDGYQQLSFLYYQLGQHKAAYETLIKYHAIKDSIQSRQFLIRLNNYKRASEDQKKESALLLLRKDNQLKVAQLKQGSIIKYFLISGLFALLITGIFIFRSIKLKRETEKLQREQLENEFKVQQLENGKKKCGIATTSGRIGDAGAACTNESAFYF